MSRVDDIIKYKQNKEIFESNKKLEKEQAEDACVKRIRLLKPRIDQLLEVGNACMNANIPLTGRAFGAREGYDTNQFETNSWSHLVGFVSPAKGQPMTELGINGGGANGVWNFRTDGIDVYEVHESNPPRVQAPQLHHLQKFLDRFDLFESSFYAYVDKTVSKYQNVVPVEPKKEPVEISVERLGIIAYNAISMLKDNGYTAQDLLSDLGLSATEYDSIITGASSVKRNHLQNERMMKLLKSAVEHIEAFEEDASENVLRALGFTKNDLAEIRFDSKLNKSESELSPLDRQIQSAASRAGNSSTPGKTHEKESLPER